MSKMKLSSKLYLGFGMVLSLLIVVAFKGYFSLGSVSSDMKAIQNQMEIASKVNSVLSHVQNAQAASIRFSLYREDKYNTQIEDEVDLALKQAGEVKELLVRDETRALADNAISQI